MLSIIVFITEALETFFTKFHQAACTIFYFHGLAMLLNFLSIPCLDVPLYKATDLWTASLHSSKVCIEESEFFEGILTVIQDYGGGRLTESLFEWNAFMPAKVVEA